MPLRVVHVYKAYPPVRGGIEGHLDLLTRLLAERGVRAEVLCARSAGTRRREERDGVRVLRCASFGTIASTPLPPFLPWALRRSAAEIVHLHYPWPPEELAWVLGGRNRPLVVSVHCEVVRQARLAALLTPLTERVFAGARRILVNGGYMNDVPLLSRHRDRVQLLPPGVDLERFRPGPAADPIWDVPHPRIVFVGRLRHYKGLPVLAAALARLAEARLIVVGDGPERSAFERSLAEHGCRHRAHFLGTVSETELISVLQSSDAAVLPSTSKAEAFGLAIAEAQACGVPAVTTEVGTATSYTLADGVSGRIVPPGDPEALAAALAWCIDPVHLEKRRAAARQHAERFLCARRMTDAVLRVYQDILRGE